VLLTLLCTVLGGGLVVIVAWDITLTLLHPTARGPLSYVANRLTWVGVRGFSLRLFGGRWLSYAGPVAVAGNVLAWVFVLWIGYALVYLPFIDSFSFDPNTPFEGKGFVEALYVSGAILTTAGFGDVVATGDALRLTTVLEAASGFGALSAAIAYVLSVYPLTTELRSTGMQLADHRVLVLSGAVRAVRESGTSVLAGLVREMTEAHEHLRRYPVLYYFESGDKEEPLSSLVFDAERAPTSFLTRRCTGMSWRRSSTVCWATSNAISWVVVDVRVVLTRRMTLTSTTLPRCARRSMHSSPAGVNSSVPQSWRLSWRVPRPCWWLWPTSTGTTRSLSSHSKGVSTNSSLPREEPPTAPTARP
jgi:hypothetical protein